MQEPSLVMRIVVTLVLACSVACVREPTDGELFIAAEEGDLARVTALLEAGGDVRALDPRGGWSALMIASREGDVAIVRLLLAADPDPAHVNAVGPGEWTALRAAAGGGNPDTVRLLLDAGADVERAGLSGARTPLMEAAWNGETEIARMLIERGARVDVAADGVHFEITALVAAARHGHADIVELLLAADADVNARDSSDETALSWAAGLPPSRRGDDPDGPARIVRCLLEAGADVNASDRDGITPLMRAAEAGRGGVVRRLLAAGADPNAATDGFTHGGKTVLMYAAGRTGVLEELLEAGADVNAKTRDGLTALIESSRFGVRDAVRVLLDAVADIDAESQYDGTAVSLAVASRHIELVEDLLEHGAAVPKGALREAEALGDMKMVALLRSYQQP